MVMPARVVDGFTDAMIDRFVGVIALMLTLLGNVSMFTHMGVMRATSENRMHQHCRSGEQVDEDVKHGISNGGDAAVKTAWLLYRREQDYGLMTRVVNLNRRSLDGHMPCQTEIACLSTLLDRQASSMGWQLAVSDDSEQHGSSYRLLMAMLKAV